MSARATPPPGSGSPERVLLIGGMHRSGTSLVAEMLQSAGVDIGSRLLGARRGNPDGHFEDLDFVEFHQSCLTDGLRAGLVEDEASPAWSETMERRARALLDRKSGSRTWGWKDPRTVLFLDRWTDLRPALRAVFVVRHPFDVVLSLLRRGTEPEVLVDPMLGLTTWRIYNSAILRHVQAAPERSVVFDVYDLLAAPEHFLSTVDARFDLGLAPVDVSGLVKEHLLRPTVASPVTDSLLEVIDEPSLRLWRELSQVAESVGGAPATEPHGAHVELQGELGTLAEVLREILPGRREAAAPALDLVLASLDPEIEAERRRRGRRALDELRDHARNLEADVGELRTHAGNLEERVDGLGTHVQNLEERRDELERHTANLERRVEELATHAANLEQLLKRWGSREESAGWSEPST